MSNILSIKNLTVKYEQVLALDRINLQVKEGDFLAIIGPNGGGKTTFLKAVLGLVKKESGEILIENRSIEKNRHLIGYVPQFSLVDRKFPISVLEVVMTGVLKPGLHLFYKYSKEDKKVALEKLDMVGIKHLANRQIADLSGGEFQRLLIARALATNPKILFLDEPTASVDPHSKEQIYEVLATLNKDITIVMVTHDLLAITKTVKNIACLNRTLIYHGEPVLTETVVNQMYGCPVDLIAHGVPHRVLGEHTHDTHSEDCNKNHALTNSEKGNKKHNMSYNKNCDDYANNNSKKGEEQE